jgi:hypothetical protein
MDSLQFAREIWREFNLNESKGAGMTLTENGVVVKKHGQSLNTDNFRVMGDSIVGYRRPVEKIEPEKRRKR